MRTHQRTSRSTWRFWPMVAWNLATAFLVGTLFWWFGGAITDFSSYTEMILVYALVYGSLMGLASSYLGPQIGKFGLPWSWLLLIVMLLALSATASGAIGVIFIWLNLIESRQFWMVFGDNIVLGSAIALTIGISLFAFESARVRLDRVALRLQSEELEKERARKAASQARLASLESRLHPHFLFNTLNAIAALIRQDPARAEEMVQRLSALLRFSLDSVSEGLVPLSQEVSVVAGYLSIEHERLVGRLKYSLDIPEELETMEVPPFSVQTLVENSIRHAVAPAREGGEIRVRARRDQGQLMIEVWDSGQADAATIHLASGRGLDNLQSRLLALFGESASLEFDRREAGFCAKVLLPLETN